MELTTSKMYRVVGELGLVQAVVATTLFLVGVVPLDPALGAIGAGGMLIGGAALATIAINVIPLIDSTPDFVPDRDQCYNCREHSLDPPEDLGVFVECPDCGSKNLR